MGSGGGGGGGGNSRPTAGKSRARTRQPIRPTAPPKPKPIQRDVTKAASAKRAEVGVKYTPTGATIKTTTSMTPGGISPGAVRATLGAASPEAAKAGSRLAKAEGALAGRTDITTEGLGDLSRRINIGQMPAGRVTVPGVGSAALNVLNVAGQKMASTLLDKLIAGEKAVTDTSGRIMGTTDKGGTYTGRPDFKPSPTILSTGRDEPRPDVTPAVTPEVTPEVVADDMQAGLTAQESRRRRTRRFGGAGTFEEKGILMAGAGKRPTV